MYILMESNTTNEHLIGYLTSWDAIGHTDSEEYAMEWKGKNPEYRMIIFCPDKIIR